MMVDSSDNHKKMRSSLRRNQFLFFNSNNIIAELNVYNQSFQFSKERWTNNNNINNTNTNTINIQMDKSISFDKNNINVNNTNKRFHTIDANSKDNLNKNKKLKK